MANLGKYVFRMIIFLSAVGTGVWFLQEPLLLAFMGNPVINGVILVALILGILFVFRQTFLLLPEHRWVKDIVRRKPKRKRKYSPVLLATVAMMVQDGGRASSVSALSMRSVLDGIAVRLDESREISRYMIGLLIFLGLLGTFWGLLVTVQAVGDVVGAINTQSGSIETIMAGLKSGLNTPLSGMATAFSSSLFGLAGSLILGFLDLQLGQASARFYADVEDWLSSSLSFGMAGDDLTEGLNEAVADKMQQLALSIEANEIQGRDTADSLRELTKKLEQIAEGRDLSKIETALTNMAREMKADRVSLNSAITMELRALGKALNKKKG